jgi:hypothetical protein
MSPKKMIGLSFAAAAAKGYEVLAAPQCAAQIAERHNFYFPPVLLRA